MTPDQAREVLRIYRRGVDDPADPDIAEALRMVHADSDLNKWYEEQSALQQSVRSAFRTIAPPEHLQRRILAGPRRAIWQMPVVWAAAAAILIFVGIAAFLQTQRSPYSFAQFRQKMVRTAMGSYDMPMMTNDLTAIRAYVGSKQGHADYHLTPALEKLSGVGAVVFPWHSRTVSLVCLSGGPDKDVFLFVIDRKAIRETPNAPQFATIGRLPTVSWTEGEKVYLLATKGDESFLRSLL